MPIDCVNGWEAYAFCNWRGAFLPSETAWEYAVAAGSRELEFSWGSTYPNDDQYATYECNDTSVGGFLSVSSSAPVGAASLRAALSGQLDMAGDGGVWTLDSYTTCADPCTDCACLASGSTRVFRGGNFGSPWWDLTPPSRFDTTPANRSYQIGFRCGRTPRMRRLRDDGFRGPGTPGLSSLKFGCKRRCL